MSAKFQGDWMMHLCFIAIFAKCAKIRKKTKKKIETLATRISGMAGATHYCVS